MLIASAPVLRKFDSRKGDFTTKTTTTTTTTTTKRFNNLKFILPVKIYFNFCVTTISDANVQKVSKSLNSIFVKFKRSLRLQQHQQT